MTDTKQDKRTEIATALTAELAKRIPDLITTDEKHQHLVNLTAKCYFGNAFSIDEKTTGGGYARWMARGTGKFFISLKARPMERTTIFNHRKDGTWDYDGIAEYITRAVKLEAEREAAMDVERISRRATSSLEQRLELSKSEECMIELRAVPTDPKLFRIEFRRDLNEESILRLIATLRDHGFLS